jgi:hypothetical protein
MILALAEHQTWRRSWKTASLRRGEEEKGDGDPRRIISTMA